MTKKLVWIVEDRKTGAVKSNWSTGTRVHTRKHNAEVACRKARYGSGENPYVVVEYELVPTEVL